MARIETIERVCNWLKDKGSIPMPFGKRSVHIQFNDDGYQYFGFVHDHKGKLLGNLNVDARYLNAFGFPAGRNKRILSVVQLLVWEEECAVMTPWSLLSSPTVNAGASRHFAVPEEKYSVFSILDPAPQILRMEEIDA